MNILFNPRTPVIVGTAVLAVAGWLLMLYSPVPGNLSTAHAQIPGLTQLEGCTTCHGDQGITASCLECHSEIAEQLDENRGFHAALRKGEDFECAECHQEHNGSEYDLVNEISWGAQIPAGFRHPHVEFGLVDSHETLDCEQCHSNAEPFTLPKFKHNQRENSFLGVSQDCQSCHTDVHTYGLTPSCNTCHGQVSFDSPEFFDHGHFPLVGGHDTVPCVGCHLMPEDIASLVEDTVNATAPEGRPGSVDVHEILDQVTEKLESSNPEEGPTEPRMLSEGERPPFPFPFDRVKGKSCSDCHDSPHRADFSSRCADCHAQEGFEWLQAREEMTPDLHQTTGFVLLGAHKEASCDGCHPSSEEYEVRHPDPADPTYDRFEDNCLACHEDEHEGQFNERYSDCMDCHSRHQFVPTMFGHTDHEKVFALTGSHGAVPCIECHTSPEEGAPRKFVGTASSCQECHDAPHGNQFRKKIAANDCTSCHSGISDTFEIVEFDHAGQSGFELEGGHARAECNDCHTREPVQLDGILTEIRRYEETPKDCASCHRDVHRGQFADRESCQDCHTSSESFAENSFNHNTQSRFSLDGHHADVPCSGCHVPVKLEDGTEVVQYKPLGTECRDCHELDTGPPKNR